MNSVFIHACGVWCVRRYEFAGSRRPLCHLLYDLCCCFESFSSGTKGTKKMCFSVTLLWYYFRFTQAENQKLSVGHVSTRVISGNLTSTAPTALLRLLSRDAASSSPPHLIHFSIHPFIPLCTSIPNIRREVQRYLSSHTSTAARAFDLFPR